MIKIQYFWSQIFKQHSNNVLQKHFLGVFSIKSIKSQVMRCRWFDVKSAVVYSDWLNFHILILSTIVHSLSKQLKSSKQLLNKKNKGWFTLVAPSESFHVPECSSGPCGSGSWPWYTRSSSRSQGSFVSPVSGLAAEGFPAQRPAGLERSPGLSVHCCDQLAIAFSWKNLDVAAAGVAPSEGSWTVESGSASC